MTGRLEVVMEATLRMTGSLALYLSPSHRRARDTDAVVRSSGWNVEIVAGLSAGAQYVATGSFVVKAEQGKGSAEHEH